MEELLVVGEKIAEAAVEEISEQVVAKVTEGIAENASTLVAEELPAQRPNLDALRHRSLDSMRIESSNRPSIEDGRPWFPDFPTDWQMDGREHLGMEDTDSSIIKDNIIYNSEAADGNIAHSVEDVLNSDADALFDYEHLSLTDAEKTLIKDETGWADEIIDHIESMEQYEIYKNAGLHEAEINGRKCLLKDIDLDYVDPKSGKTNRELMEAGRNPYDSLTGEKLELHHMGQGFDSPFAELCEYSEHDEHTKTLHPYGNSWRRDVTKKNYYNNVERPNHWKARVKED